MKARNIRQRLRRNTVVVLVSFIAATLATLVTMGLIQYQTLQLLDRQIPALQSAHDMQIAMQGQSEAMLRWMLNPGKIHEEELVRHQGDFAAAKVRYKYLVGDYYRSHVESELESLVADIQSSQEKILHPRLEEHPASAPAPMDPRVHLMNRMDALFKLLDERVRQSTDEHVEATARLIRVAGMVSLILSAAFLILALVSGFGSLYRLSLAITRPLGVLASAMEAISRGERTIHLAGLTSDEFGTLGDHLRTMVKNLSTYEERLHYLNVEQGKILEFVTIGLFTIDVEFRTGAIASSLARETFGEAIKPGSDFISTIWPGQNDNAQRLELIRYLKQVRSNRLASAEMLAEINPLKSCHHTRPDGRSVELTFRFQAIGEQRETLLVLVEDRTQAKAAEDEARREHKHHDQSLEVLYQALQLGPETVRSDLDNFSRRLAAIRQLLDANTGDIRLDEIRRLLHSLKGNTRAMGFEILAREAHALENLVQNDSLRRQEMDHGLALLESELQRAGELLASMQGMSSASRREPGQIFAKRMQTMVADLAKSLEKEVELAIDVHPELLTLEGLDDAIIHLVRNALDHGIEERYERLAKGKPARARLEIRSQRLEYGFRLAVSDDGRGLDLEAIHNAARERGILPKDAPDPDEKATVRLLFQPGFSSRTGISEVSGRGLGLDAVREIASRHRGSIGVSSRPGAGCRFRIDLPLV